MTFLAFVHDFQHFLELGRSVYSAGYAQDNCNAAIERNDYLTPRWWQDCLSDCEVNKTMVCPASEKKLRILKHERCEGKVVHGAKGRSGKKG